MLNKIKLLLEISDNSLDDKLNIIIGNVTSRLKVLLGGVEPPEELEYIIVDVTVSRFNRIGSEGMQSHSVEGESITFADDDISAYKDDIDEWLSRQKESSRGKLRFI